MAASTATIIPLTRTGGSGTGADRDAWIRTRHAALVAELVRRGYPRSQAWSMATAPVAHWAEETGWGRSEFSWALGNIRSVGQCPYAHLLQGSDDATPRPYCAYRSLDEGIARTLDLLLASRYQPAWQYLVSTGDANGWFDRLLRAGWHPWSQSSVDDYRSIQGRVVRTVGADPGGSGPSPWITAGILLAAASVVAVVVLRDDSPRGR